MNLVRFYHPQSGIRVGVLKNNEIHDISEQFPTISDWLIASVNRVEKAITELDTLSSQQTYEASLFENPPSPDLPHLLAPIDHSDVWAAGVTYLQSRDARQEEAVDGGDVYARVYTANRPELFFKSHGRNVIGTRGEIGIREDSKWNVPEPELAIVMNPAMEVVGFSVGNDVSSRDIEGENPLYLPQAKLYKASCALGASILLQSANEWLRTDIHLHIERNGETMFKGSISTDQIKRRLPELVEYLGRSQEFSYGAVLLTGTALVPPSEFTLQAGDIVTITIDSIATLQNRVKVV